MNKISFGKTDLKIPSIVLGGNVFGWTLEEKPSFNILDAALDYGFNFIDTANSYSHWVEGNKGGESETIIGKWLKQKGGRDKVLITTKVGSSMGKGKPNLSKQHILEEVNHSLKRLNTDYIDLYLSHHDDSETPIEETMEAYATLVKAGKVRYIGASNFSAMRFREAQTIAKNNNLPSYQCLQTEYNLYDRENFEKKLAPYLNESEIAITSYYSLASGFLSGKYRTKEDLEKSKRGTNIYQYMNERGERILKALLEEADKYQTSPATIAIAWLISRKNITAPIVSATNLKQLKSLYDAAHLALENTSLKDLDKASAFNV